MNREVNDLVEANADSVKRTNVITPYLAAWFAAELDRIHGTLPTSTGGIVLGIPCWGEKYVERMLRWSLPSLGSERNMKVLAGKAVLIIYGIAKERDHIFKATRWLRQAGIPTLMRNIPDAIMNMVEDRNDKYGILACVQNLIVHEAGHHQMGVHMYMPDHLYCDGYFENLAKFGGKYPAIVQQSVSVNIETAEKDIEAWRNPDTNMIAMMPQAMGKMLLEHMHERSHRQIMNYGAELPHKMPDSRQVMWIGKNHLHILDTCHLISWLCPELCADAPISFSSTMDMLHPDYIPPHQWYMAGPDDGMVFCEMTGSDRIGPPGYVGPERFLMRFWQQIGFSEDYMQYTKQHCLVGIPEQETGYVTDEVIAKESAMILDMLKRNKGAAMEVFFRSQVPSRWPEEPEPEAVKEAADD